MLLPVVFRYLCSEILYVNFKCCVFGIVSQKVKTWTYLAVSDDDLFSSGSKLEFKRVKLYWMPKNVVLSVPGAVHPTTLGPDLPRVPNAQPKTSSSLSSGPATPTTSTSCLHRQSTAALSAGLASALPMPSGLVSPCILSLLSKRLRMMFTT